MPPDIVLERARVHGIACCIPRDSFCRGWPHLHWIAHCSFPPLKWSRAAAFAADCTGFAVLFWPRVAKSALNCMVFAALFWPRWLRLDNLFRCTTIDLKHLHLVNYYYSTRDQAQPSIPPRAYYRPYESYQEVSSIVGTVKQLITQRP